MIMGLALEYVEIEDPKEIRRLNKALSARLKTALIHAETRTIGYPQGNFLAKVRFLSDVGNHVFYWSAWLSKDKTIVGNFFGHGRPGGNPSLNIEVQFNLPVVEFSRTSGGAFLRHIGTDSIVLGHRGIVTLGHGRVPKSKLFAEMAATLREANTGNGVAEFLLIGELESPTLISDIDTFSSELRRAVRSIKANTTTKPGKPKTPSNASVTLSGKLRQYFDEFSGRLQLKGRKKSIADCYHGTVVRAIRDGFHGSPKTLKSQAIDLTVITGKRVFLFEVKTSANPQSVYTAIGQLTAHAPVVAKYAPKASLVRVMVLPERPAQRLCTLLEDQLSIRLLTFARSAQGHITIDGLKNLE
jgi:hypothetical protein